MHSWLLRHARSRISYRSCRHFKKTASVIDNGAKLMLRYAARSFKHDICAAPSDTLETTDFATNHNNAANVGRFSGPAIMSPSTVPGMALWDLTSP